MSDDDARMTPADLAGVWASLEHQGYALTSDWSIGLPDKACENFSQSYFNDDTLRHDDGDWPVDRQRARDVIRYKWRDNNLHVKEFASITITDRAGIDGRRDHSRVELLRDPLAAEIIQALLQLVPPRRRQPDGTFGVNLFRTFTNVVTTPHHDDEEYVIVYLLNRVGGGAESYLYAAGDAPDSAEAVLRKQLNPGEILIFEDRLFKHGATPLENPPGGTAMRDALICTIDYPQTYLARSGSPAA